VDKEELKKNFPGIIASVVVTRDGDPLEIDLPDNVSPQTFSIMCATIMGAAATANKEMGGEIPQYIVVESQITSLLIIRTAKKCILGCVVENGADKDSILQGMKEVAENM